jgi:hypothetical protein
MPLDPYSTIRPRRRSSRRRLNPATATVLNPNTTGAGTLATLDVYTYSLKQGIRDGFGDRRSG